VVPSWPCSRKQLQLPCQPPVAPSLVITLHGNTAFLSSWVFRLESSGWRPSIRSSSNSHNHRSQRFKLLRLVQNVLHPELRRSSSRNSDHSLHGMRTKSTDQILTVLGQSPIPNTVFVQEFLLEYDEQIVSLISLRDRLQERFCLSQFWRETTTTKAGR